ncbi:MAG: cyclic nucleotide-binding domain-containing protein [Armatimonadota bacterium]|nr:cyclic nucleotide-binding domain-containing protein [Armatimonadota bacterium]MDR7450319.1 cyclic nucleotide-binding domain-containing protein [Armatimonadota bacterium]MDR7467098.1 cyclic nucleotide-binding domain-containing protein [Armatimonadota bacterium]MDR7493360.1 cyclic nucleotide-binding domain-containing protein [Armatimonadota bacterium]MDR7499368.1 cyclic nucleotide-binding domain-containing protein [Armatimonadota bacterium]
MATREELIDLLSGLALFADLSRPQLEAVVHRLEEEYFAAGQRILRQGFSGGSLYIILEGEAAVSIDGTQRSVLGKGDFFGEISLLLGEPPIADVVALRPLRCLSLPGPELAEFLLAYPHVAYRMLQAEARRLRTTSLWR